MTTRKHMGGLAATILVLAFGCGGNSSSGGGGGGAGGSPGNNNNGAGGTSGGGSVDGGVDLGSAGPTAGGCTDPKLLFCEDFETVPLGNAASTRWTPNLKNGTLTVDAAHAYGARALHVHADGGGYAYIKPTSFSAPGNSFFGRVRVWITATPTVPDYAHFTLVEAAGTTPGLIRPLGGQLIPAPAAGKTLWGVGSDLGPTGDWLDWKTTAPVTAGAWQCMEWQMDAAKNAINVWIDGVAKPELSVSTKMHGGNAVDFVFPTFNSIWFGWWLYQSGTKPASFDLWLDDIALGTTRVGC